jgi:hypothetical protein
MQRNEPNDSTILARPVCLFACVSDASFPYARSSLPHPQTGPPDSNQPSHITVLARPVCPFVCVSDVNVYVGIVEGAPASPYAYSSPTLRFPDERTPIEAKFRS